ncbi:MAG: hypothetical protein AAFR77_03775 [Cyanobacteria bacterium J06631_2]
MDISLLDLKNSRGDRGLVIPGQESGDRLGEAVYSAGDINGDGIADLVVTATDAGIVNSDEYSYYDSDRRGEAYVIFGRQDNNNSNFDLDNLNGSNGFKVSGLDAEHNLGSAVSAGDLNGDGIDDLVLGAPNAGLRVSSYGYSYSQNNGEAYVIFGQRNGFSADFALESLNGSNGFTIKGIDAEDLLGTAVTSAGDINGDGIDDLAVSAVGGGQIISNNNGFSYSDRRGEVYVLFGDRNGFESRINLFNLNGSNGFIIDGKDANDSLGGSLSNAGDLNGDGLEDLVIGASNAGNVLDSPFADGYSDQRGEVYVLYGSRNGFPSRFTISDRLDGIDGFGLAGIGIEDNLGTDVNNAGDLNGDGIDDLIIGAANASVSGEYSQEGQAYVVFGSRNGLGNQFDLNRLDGSNGFSVSGLDDAAGLGNAVSAGDFNGDGIDDLFLAASNAGDTISAYGFEYSDRRGEAYIVFGSASGFASQVDLVNLSSDVGAIIRGIDEEDLLGNAIASGGDLNGDGADDLVVTATGIDLGNEYTKEGTAYVIFGTPQDIESPTPTPTPEATPYNDSLTGSSGDDQISGQSGDDTISGGDGNDNLAGDNGGDSIFGGNGVDTLDGGNNNDTLFGGTGRDLLNGGNNQDRLVGDAGRDTLFGGTDNDLLEGRGDNDILNGTNPNNFELQLGEQDTLIGGAGQDLFILGDENQVYYDDRNSATEGSTDYALIEDFNPGQDQIQLKGDRNNYSLAFYPDGQGNTLANLFYLQSGATPERVGILKNIPQDLTLDNSAFVFLGQPPVTMPQTITGQATPYNDEIVGTAGDDRIAGQSGDDTITGGDGNDFLDGEDSGDSLFGNNGNDTLYGRNNNDFLFGGDGEDLLDGGNNQDQLKGDSGNDSLFGGTDNDRLEGGSGNDTLYGANPNNFEVQLGEQDTLVGGAGQDLFILGDENQLYYNDRNSGTEGSTDYAFIEDFNPGQDQIQLKGDRNNYSLSFYPDGQGNALANLFYLQPGATPERVGILKNISQNLTLDNPAFIYLQSEPQQPQQPVLNQVGGATPYNDQIIGTPLSDQILGGSGDDTLLGNDGNDLLDGEDSGDALFGGDGNDTLYGRNNNDVLFGGADDDLLNGGNNQDQLNGDNGNDTLYGGTDNDRLDGGFGNDTLYGANPDNFDVQIYEQDTLMGGEGRDLYVLGDQNQRYYDDRNRGTEGSTSYALIQDFNPGEDQIQLKGDRNSYSLSFYPSGTGSNLANIFYLESGAIPERVGIIENVASDLTLDSRAFSFV